MRRRVTEMSTGSLCPALMIRSTTTLPSGLRYLTVAEVPRLFEFSTDMQPVAVEPNRLNTQVLVRYYEEEWDRVNR